MIAGVAVAKVEMGVAKMRHDNPIYLPGPLGQPMPAVKFQLEACGTSTRGAPAGEPPTQGIPAPLLF